MVCAAFQALGDRYDPAKQDERAAFADDGYVAPVDNLRTDRPAPINSVRYSDVLKLFPIPALARRIFGTLENGRIDRRLRRQYRGLARDLDLIREDVRFTLPPELATIAPAPRR